MSKAYTITNSPHHSIKTLTLVKFQSGILTAVFTVTAKQVGGEWTACTKRGKGANTVQTIYRATKLDALCERVFRGVPPLTLLCKAGEWRHGRVVAR